MAECLDCGADAERFIRAANDWKPAVLTLEKAKSLYRLTTDGRGRLIEQVVRVHPSEPTAVRRLLEDRWLACHYERGALPRDLVKSVSLGLATSWGGLNDAIAFLASMVRRRGLENLADAVPRKRTLALRRRHPGLRRVRASALEGDAAVGRLVRAADDAGFIIVALGGRGEGVPARARIGIGEGSSASGGGRLAELLRRQGVESRLVPWERLIGAKREPGETFLLPTRMPGMPAARYKRLIRGTRWPGSRSSGRPIIVIADDEREIASFYKWILEMDDYEIHTASDGVEAMELCRTHNPDLALLNFMMPRLDGVSACSRLRADPVFRWLSIIVYSASPIREMALSAGADAFLPTPTDPRTLRSTVAELLEV